VRLRDSCFSIPDRSGHLWFGEPVATPWDPELAAAMRHRNLRIEEELIRDALSGASG
jgi:hypothetical protein